MVLPSDQVLVAIPDRPEEDLRLIEESTPEDLVRVVREEAPGLDDVMIAPDASVGGPEGVDLDAWIALVSVLVVEGVTAIRTTYPALARRILDLHLAIRLAGTEPS